MFYFNYKVNDSYCKTRNFSCDKFSLTGQSKCFRSSNFHSSVAVPFYVSKMNILAALHFHWFVSSVRIVKIHRRWRFLVLQYVILISQVCSRHWIYMNIIQHKNLNKQWNIKAKTVVQDKLTKTLTIIHKNCLWSVSEID